MTQFGAVGDNTTDDTVAIQAAYTAAGANGGGTVFWPQPPVSYKITAAINVPAGVCSEGLFGMGTSDYPVITQWTYGLTIFTCGGSTPNSGDHITIRDLSGQYGPTTTLAGTIAAGVSSLVVLAAGTIAALDWLILDQYPNLEQVQVSAAYSGGTTIPLASATTLAHANSAWVRDQAAVTGPSVYNSPARDVAGFANFTNGNDCRVERCGIQAMVTGVKFRGIPSTNASNNYNNSVVDLQTDYVQFACLAQQQTNFKNTRNRYTTATEGQTTAPGHGLYMTGLIGPAGAWASGTTYALYQQVTQGTALSGTAAFTVGSATVTFSTGQSLTAGNWLLPSSQGTNYIIQTVNSPTQVTLAAPYSGTTAGAATVTLNPIQYISLSAGNVGNSPVSSPSFWSPQSYPSLAFGWRSRNYDVTVTDAFCNPGANFKDWSGIKIKFTTGGTIKGTIVDGAVRGFDFQEFHGASCDGISFLNFIPPISSDSSAAAIDLLDCNWTSIGAGTVQLSTSSGGAIDMPVVLSRVDGTNDPITGVPLGHDNTFSDIAAFSNYDNLFTSQAFRTQCLRDRFVNCYLNDSGGQNPPAFGFTFNSTTNTYANGSQLITPTVVGTTHVAFVSSGSTGVVWSIDNNLVPANPVYTDPGGGAVITNAYVTNVGGNLGLSPQSTSADVIGATAPAGAAFKWLDLKNSVGNAEIFSTNASGMKLAVLSSVNGNGAYLGLGYNLSGGYPLSGTTFAGIAAVADNNGIGNAGTGIYAIAAENQSSIAQGTDWLFAVVTAGGLVQYKAARIYNSGDFVVNATGAQLTVGATAGFFYAPSMAGIPTGSLTGHTGASAFVFDTADKILWVNTGAASWSNVAAQQVAGAGPASGTTFLPDSIQRLGSGNSGNSYLLPNANTCPGSIIRVKCTNNGGLYTYSLTVTGGGNIDGAASYVFISSQSTAEVAFESDGTNWQIVDNYKSRSLYVEDYPTFHGFVEWNGQPNMFAATGNVTTGSVNVMRIVAQNGGTISNIVMEVGTAGTSFTAATSTNVSNAVSSGGLIELTVAVSPPTGTVVVVAGVTGTTEANGAWVWTQIDSTHGTLNGSTFVNAYVSGGTVVTSANCCAIYSSTGAFLTATADQVAAWGTTGLKTMALATPITMVPGTVYYVVSLASFTGTAIVWASGAPQAVANAGLAGANLRWSVNGTGATSLPSSFTPSSNQTGSGGTRTYWFALS